MRRGSFVRAQILFALHGIERRLPDPGTCRPALVCRADYHALLNYVSQTSKKDLVRLSVYSAKEFPFLVSKDHGCMFGRRYVTGGLSGRQSHNISIWEVGCNGITVQQ